MLCYSTPTDETCTRRTKSIMPQQRIIIHASQTRMYVCKKSNKMHMYIQINHHNINYLRILQLICKKDEVIHATNHHSRPASSHTHVCIQNQIRCFILIYNNVRYWEWQINRYHFTKRICINKTSRFININQIKIPWCEIYFMRP